MGREGENLPLARAIRLARPALRRRVLRLADYTGGRLSFGNERAAPLVFPWHRSRTASGGGCAVRISARHCRARAPSRQEGALRASRAAITSSTMRG